MPLVEFYEWIAFARIEPIGGERQDYNAARSAFGKVEPFPFQIKPTPTGDQLLSKIRDARSRVEAAQRNRM
jgi:hypothetical protein